MRFLLFLFCLVIFLLSCRSIGYLEKPNKDFLELLNRNSDSTKGSLLLNGFYSLIEYDGSKVKIEEIIKSEPDRFIDPMYFYGNNTFLSFRGLQSHSLKWDSCLFYENKQFLLEKGAYGAYQVVDSTIYAIAYTYFVGTSHFLNNMYLCYYKGKILDKSKIVDWQLVPPYPKLLKHQAKLKDNQRKLEYLKVKKSFQFHKSLNKTKLDSTEAWINKYRNKTN